MALSMPAGAPSRSPALWPLAALRAVLLLLNAAAMAWTAGCFLCWGAFTLPEAGAGKAVVHLALACAPFGAAMAGGLPQAGRRVRGLALVLNLLPCGFFALLALPFVFGAAGAGGQDALLDGLPGALMLVFNCALMWKLAPPLLRGV